MLIIEHDATAFLQYKFQQCEEQYKYCNKYKYMNMIKIAKMEIDEIDESG